MKLKIAIVVVAFASSILAAEVQKPASGSKPAAASNAHLVRVVKNVPVAKRPSAAVVATGQPQDRARKLRRRDPFVSPVVERPAGQPVCRGGGRKCLEVNETILKGIAEGPTGKIALVVNSQNRAYFLHENDPVFNGQVVRITRDSVVFRERHRDPLGRTLTRDVVKRLGAPSV